MNESSFNQGSQNPSRNELDLTPEADLEELDLIEADFIELDNADYEVPYAYSDYHLRSTTDRVAACVTFFKLKCWKYTSADLQELRDHFYYLPELTSYDLLKLVQQDFRELPSRKLKPANKNKFDKAYHARRITDVRSFLKNIPALLTDLFGPGRFEDNHWQWKWAQSQSATLAYTYLMERFERRKADQIPGVLVRLEANPHQDLIIEDRPQNPAIIKLINAVKMQVPSKKAEPDMNKCKRSILNLICDMLGLEKATMIADAAKAQEEDKDHYPAEFLMSRDMDIPFIPSNLRFYCSDIEVEPPLFWSWDNMKNSLIYDEYQNACGYYHPSQRHLLYLVFRSFGTLFMLYSSPQGYEGLGGSFIGSNSPAGYVIEPLQNWIRVNIKPPSD